MTAMTENKLETNHQEEEEVEKRYLEPPFAVKKLIYQLSNRQP
jgi:hypothetical protein